MKKLIRKNILFSRFLYLLAGFFIGTVFLFTNSPGLANSTQQQEAVSFSNKDLEQYKPKAPENESSKQALKTDNTSQDEAKRKTDKKLEQREQGYWCTKGKQSRRKIAMARDEVEEFRKLIDEFKDTEMQTTGRGKISARKNVRKAEKNMLAAQKRLRDKEALLSDIEEEAHRKNIPAGWLRCQFE